MRRSVVPEAANTLVDIDDAMRLGYNWRWGPFELIDKLGTEWFAGRLAEAEGWPVPHDPGRGGRAAVLPGGWRG